MSNTNHDPVNHPNHYTSGGIECIDCIKAALGENFIGFLIGNVIKYCYRYRNKNGIEDLKKSKWYLEKAIKELEEQENNNGCPYIDGTCGTLEFFDRIPTLPEINKDKILRCCHEIEMCLGNCFDTGSILLKCDIDFIVKQLDFIRKELSDGGSKTN